MLEAFEIIWKPLSRICTKSWSLSKEELKQDWMKFHVGIRMEFSSSSSILSKTGEIKWKKDQYVVVSQDENAGNSSPLEVFISDSESEALEKIHSNMTAEKPIYFLFPSNLESLYQEKY